MARRRRHWEYRFGDASVWTPLPLQFAADGAVAALPMLDTPHVASRRVTLHGAEGNLERQTLDAMFLPDRRADFHDGFEGD